MPPGQHTLTGDQVEQVIRLATPSIVTAVKADLENVRNEILAAIQKNRSETDARMDKFDKRLESAEKARTQAKGYLSGLSAAGAVVMVIIDFATRVFWRR